MDAQDVDVLRTLRNTMEGKRRQVPFEVVQRVDTETRALLDCMLVPDPRYRATLEQVCL